MDFAKYGKIAAVNLKHNLVWHILLSAAFLCTAPVFFGMSRLDPTNTAKLLESFVVLTGIILLVPYALPEQNPQVREVTSSKYTSRALVYLVRELTAVLALIAVTAAFLLVLKAGECQFSMGRYLFAAASGALFLGGLGALAHAVSDNIAVGYMVPIGFYAFTMSMKPEQLKIFYLYSLSALNSMTEKYWLAAMGLLMIAASILWRQKRRV